MSAIQEVTPDWRERIGAILADQIGALGGLVLDDALASTGFDKREPSRREALHFFEVLKKELPSHLHEGEVPSEILKILFGH